MCGYDVFCPGSSVRPLTPDERRVARPLRRSSRYLELGAWQICDTCGGVFCEGSFREFPCPVLIRRGYLDKNTGALRPPTDARRCFPLPAS